MKINTSNYRRNVKSITSNKTATKMLTKNECDYLMVLIERNLRDTNFFVVKNYVKWDQKLRPSYLFSHGRNISLYLPHKTLREYWFNLYLYQISSSKHFISERSDSLSKQMHFHIQKTAILIQFCCSRVIFNYKDYFRF